MLITDWLAAGWPILIGLLTLVVLAAQAWIRLAVLEEKVKSIFWILNDMLKK